MMRISKEGLKKYCLKLLLLLTLFLLVFHDQHDHGTNYNCCNNQQHIVATTRISSTLLRFIGLKVHRLIRVESSIGKVWIFSISGSEAGQICVFLLTENSQSRNKLVHDWLIS